MMLNSTEITKEIVTSRKFNIINKNLNKESFSNISIYDAYQVQQNVISNLGLVVSGWKLGGTNSKTRELFNTNELYWGPIFNGCIMTKAQDIKLHCGEIEIALKLNKNIQSIDSKVYPNDLSKYIDSVALAIEYPQSFISNISEVGIQALISDCCGSGQCLISKEVPFSKFRDGIICVEVDSIIIEELSTDLLIGGLYQTACDFIHRSTQFDFELKGGQWIFTGGLSECRSYKKNSHLKVRSSMFNLDFWLK